MRHTKVPSSRCLCCGVENDYATNVTGRGGPSAGDISVCFRCGSIAQYSQDLQLEPVDMGEAPPDVLAVAKQAQRLIHARKPN